MEKPRRTSSSSFPLLRKCLGKASVENVSQGTSGLLFERTTATSSMNLDAWNAVENWHLAPISRVADCFLEGKTQTAAG